MYAYRFDWDDHRKYIIADFQELIGAAHATEIPLLTGNNKLVDGYGFLIYPNGPSKRFTSKNLMKFWTNFAKNGNPGTSSNGLKWIKYDASDKNKSNYMVIDNKSNLGMQTDSTSFLSLTKDLYKDLSERNLLPALLVVDQKDSLALRAVKNLKNGKGLSVEGFSVYEAVKFENLIIEKNALEKLSKRLG